MSSAPQYPSDSTFTFYLSSDLNLLFQLRVDRLLGRIPAYSKNPSQDGIRPSALFVEVCLCSHGEVLGVPVRTGCSEAGIGGCLWDTWLTLPVKYRDLDHATQLACTIWEIREGRECQPLGGSTCNVFSKKGRLKSGVQLLTVWSNKKADIQQPTLTPGKVPVKERGELGRVDQVLKRYERGEIDHLNWLDKLSLAAIEKLRCQKYGDSLQQTASSICSHGLSAEIPNPDKVELTVELLTFPQAVIYQQLAVGTTTIAAMSSSTTTEALGTALPGTSGSGVEASPVAGSGSMKAGSSIILLHDPEVGTENPADLKAQKLARSMNRGMVDKNMKPDTEERLKIEAVLGYPPNRPLSLEDRTLLWQYRFALITDKRALTKFLKCVDWSDATEARQAAELMQQWAIIDVADALELLSPDFTNEEVRGYAVDVLQSTDDDELVCYLLQLVQALRYEACDDSRLSRFLVKRAHGSVTVACMLFWYLCTELDDPAFGARASYMQGAFLQHGSPGIIEESISLQLNLMARLRHIIDIVKTLRGSVVRKSEVLRDLFSPSGQCFDMCHLSCPYPLDPRIQLLGVAPEQCSVFKSALTPLRLSFRALLPQQSGDGAMPADDGRGLAMAQVSSDPWEFPDTHSIQPPEATVTDPVRQQQSPVVLQRGQGGSRIVGGASGSQMPVRQQATDFLSRKAFVAPHSPLVTMIYKKGDDLRQDQLVVHMFSLMDRLLKREHLDLRITPYQVLATSSSDGLIQFVPSLPLASILAEHRSIHRFVAMHHPDPKGPFGLCEEVLNTFVRSCAGSCVMTYILGVGDRHLDNLMITSDGRLFHIDFGYILGRDPKPFPPPMKLCKEMVDAMGGQDSDHYRQFQTYCCEAYNILRKSSNLLLSLFHLMAGASIPDIQSDPEKALLKLQEKLRLDLKDEDAAVWMQQLLSESATALIPQIMEATHKWAQYWR